MEPSASSTGFLSQMQVMQMVWTVEAVSMIGNGTSSIFLSFF
jgi:hypothetical protein